LGEGYEDIKAFMRSTKVDADDHGIKAFDRQILRGGFIGGHCVIPAVEKLDSVHPSLLLKSVLLSNINREKEVTLGEA
jgi:hypothetical protein